MKKMPGSYALILYCKINELIQIGKNKKLKLQSGYYVYCGSAFGPGGIAARVGRHFKLNKKQRWHIDYLREKCTIKEAWICYSEKKLEHQWSSEFSEQIDSLIPLRKFGSTDCKCNSHLFYFKRKPNNSFLSSSDLIEIIKPKKETLK